MLMDSDCVPSTVKIMTIMILPTPGVSLASFLLLDPRTQIGVTDVTDLPETLTLIIGGHGDIGLKLSFCSCDNGSSIF